MNNNTTLQLRSVFILFFIMLFQLGSSLGQCSGSETLMGHMGRLFVNATDYPYEPKPVLHNPCEIIVHPMQAGYIDINITLVASAIIEIFDENNNLVETIVGHGFNNVPKRTIRVFGGEARLRFSRNIMHPHEQSIFWGNYTSDGVDANEEVQECSGSRSLYSSSGAFSTAGREVVMTGQGMSSPCDWIIEPVDATSISIELDMVYAARVHILDENDNVVYAINHTGEANNLGPYVVNGSKATVRNITSYSNISFWNGMYTSNGVDEECTSTVSILNSASQASSDEWNSGGGSASIGAGNEYLTVSDNNGQASSVLTNTLDLSKYMALEFTVSIYARYLSSGSLYFEKSINGGQSFEIIKRFSIGNGNSDISLASFGIFGRDYDFSFMDMADYSANTIIRVRSAANGLARISAIAVKGMGPLRGDEEILAIPDKLKINDPEIDFSNVQGEFTGPGWSNNIFSPQTAGVGQHNIIYAFDDGKYCYTASNKNIIIYDEENLCDGDFSLDFQDTIYSYEDPIELVGPIDGGVFEGEVVSRKLVDPTCEETTVIYSNFEGNGNSLPNEWSDNGGTNVAYYAGDYELELHQYGIMYSELLNLESYDALDISFLLDSYNSDGAQLFIELSSDGGLNYETNLLTLGPSDYSNVASISFSYKGTFTDNSRVRFRSERINKYQIFYIDEIKIIGNKCSVSGEFCIDPSETNPGTYDISYIGLDNGCSVIVSKPITIVKADLTTESSGCGPDCSNGNVIHEQGFEGNYQSDGWLIGSIFGGFFGNNDAELSSANTASGSYSMLLRDNSGGSSSITSPSLDLSSELGVGMEFSLYTTSFEAGEDFFVEVSVDGGISFTEMGRFIVGQDFNNNSRTTISATYEGQLSDNTKIRIRCDASDNGDIMYVDDIVIKTCSEGGPPSIDFTLPPSATTKSVAINTMPSPAGGILSGPGIMGTTFDPSVAGVGTHQITYSFEAAEGCSAMLTKEVVVEESNYSIECIEIDNDDGTSSGVARIDIVDGYAPYTYTVDGVSKQSDNELFIDIQNLECGLNAVVVVDAKGSSATCEVNIGFSFADQYNYLTDENDGLRIDLSCFGIEEIDCSTAILRSVVSGLIVGHVEVIGDEIHITGLTEDAILELSFSDANGDIVESITTNISVSDTDPCKNETLVAAGYVRVPILTILDAEPPGLKGSQSKNNDFDDVMLRFSLIDGSSGEMSFGEFSARLLESLSSDLSPSFDVFDDFDCINSDLSEFDIQTGSGASIYLDFASSDVYIKAYYDGDPIKGWGAKFRGFILEALIQSVKSIIVNTYNDLFNGFSQPTPGFGKDDLHETIGDILDYALEEELRDDVKIAVALASRLAASGLKMFDQVLDCYNGEPTDITSIIVPKCWWYRNDLGGVNCTPGYQRNTSAVEYIEPFLAGVIDGVGETVIGIGQLAELIAAWSPQSPTYNLPSARMLRAETCEFIDLAYRIKNDSEYRGVVAGQIAEQFGAYVDDLALLDCKSEYLSGKLAVGIADVLLGLKAGKIRNLANILKKGALGLNDILGLIVNSFLRNDQLIFELIEQTATGFTYKLSQGGAVALELIYIKGSQTLFKLNNLDALKVFDWFNGVDNFAREIAVPGRTIPASEIKKKALRIDVSNSGDQSLIDDIGIISAGGNPDPKGEITESIMRRIFAKSDLEQVPESVIKIDGNQGFDHLLLKRDNVGRIIDVVIVDSKQKSPSVRLSQLKNGDVQMTDSWVDDVLTRMTNPGNSEITISLAREIQIFKLSNKIKLKVAAIDRGSKEIWIMNIGETN